MAVMEYFSLKRGDKAAKATESKDTHHEQQEHVGSPLLNAEEEKFLRELADEGTPPPLPSRPVTISEGKQPRDAQSALMDGAEQIALPTSPPVETNKQLDTPHEDEHKTKNKFSSYVSSTLERGGSILGKYKEKGKAKEEAKAEAKAAKEASKKGKEAEKPTEVLSPEAEAEKEKDDLSGILDQLNLSAVNNRVFSFSKESQDLMDKFKVVLKDVINGAPTAYDDLEGLLKGSEEQLNKMFEAMPPFLQNLIKQLPAKMTAALGPEVLAAAAEKPSASLEPGAKPKKMKLPVPSLKKLLSVEGAVATMLRSILNFLKLRFPMLLTGTNMLLSLAVFILLFVFWYCHKRGKETRLEREKTSAAASAENSDSDLEDSIILTPTNYYEESLRKKAAEQASLEQGESSRQAQMQAPLAIHDPAVDQRPVSPRVENLPSVLDLPEPAAVPLPEETPKEEREAVLVKK